MNTPRKVLLSLVVVGALGSVIGLGAFSAFSSTTANDNNSFAAGTVAISDNDAGGFLYQVTNQKPGVNTDKCIKVTYTGSLDSDVRLYSTTSIPLAGPGQYINLTITPGTIASPTFPDCTGFTADAGGDLYNGTLAGFATSNASFGTGLADYPGAGTKWVTNDSVIYRVRVSVQNSNAAQGAAVAAHNFTWEAQNQ
jgi:hypothetical protein